MVFEQQQEWKVRLNFIKNIFKKLKMYRFSNGRTVNISYAENKFLKVIMGYTYPSMKLQIKGKLRIKLANTPMQQVSTVHGMNANLITAHFTFRIA